MSKQMSEHAAAAKAIRAEIKKNGIEATVRASSGSMSSSVRIKVIDQAPWVFDEIEKFASDYQYGHFDDMQDMYVMSNSKDLPQVRYVFVYAEFSDNLRQQAWDMICDYHCLERSSIKDKPSIFNHEINGFHGTIYTDQLIYNCLTNTRRYVSVPNFWKNPAKRVRAVLSEKAEVKEDVFIFDPIADEVKPLTQVDINKIKKAVGVKEINSFYNQLGQEVVLYEHPTKPRTHTVLAEIEGVAFDTGFYSDEYFYNKSDLCPVLKNGNAYYFYQYEII